MGYVPLLTCTVMSYVPLLTVMSYIPLLTVMSNIPLLTVMSYVPLLTVMSTSSVHSQTLHRKNNPTDGILSMEF